MIVFRVDASTQIGSGHLMRCLTLANKLVKDSEIVFICRQLIGNLVELIEQQGYVVHILSSSEPAEQALTGYERWLGVSQIQDAAQTIEILKQEDITCLIVDSYAIDEQWENMVRPYVNKLVVIDDLVNRAHNCDIFLNNNFQAELKTEYGLLLPQKCRKYLGLEYLLLRNEFYHWRDISCFRNEIEHRILVAVGGSDPTNETMKVLRAITQFDKEQIVDVVVGGSNPYKSSIKEYCAKQKKFFYHEHINYMARLMAQASLAIGAGGTMIWERCFTGVPSIVIAIAENQVEDSKIYHDEHLIWFLGESKEVTEVDIIKAIQYLSFNTTEYLKIKKYGLELFKKDKLDLLVNDILA